MNKYLSYFKNVRYLTFGIYVDTFWVLLASVFLYAESLAIPILILQDMSILLPLQPSILQIKQYGFCGSSFH